MTIGVVAPSGAARDRATVDRGAAALERLGFKVTFGRHVDKARGYLAGSDHERAEDLLAMLERDDVDGIVCLGGGYGAMRTVAALNLDRLRRLAGRPAKPFIGFSDLTVIHAMLRRELGWVTFYGPMIQGFEKSTDYTLAAFRRALMETEPFDILHAPGQPPVETLVGGTAAGRLAGGCLALVVSLIGTPWEIDFADTIGFFEDIHEQPYRVDRMVSQLLASGGLSRCVGIVIGEHVDCEPDRPERSLELEDIFGDLIRPLGVPTIYGLPIGHGQHLATLPLGTRVALDAGAQRLRIVEPGVC